MASGTLCVILTLETKSGRRQNPGPSLLFQKINLFALLYYSIHLLARGKVSHNWEQREKIDFCCTFLSIFVTVFLDSLSPVDAILTLGGRYSLPAHMLSHGRKNTSKKNKELSSFQLSYLAKMRDLLLYILSIFYCFQCSICYQIFSVYTFVVLKTEFLDTLRYSGFEVSKTSSLALITLFAPFSALCTQRVITIKKSTDTVLVKWRLTGRKGEQTKPNFQFP